MVRKCYVCGRQFGTPYPEQVHTCGNRQCDKILALLKRKDSYIRDLKNSLGKFKNEVKQSREALLRCNPHTARIGDPWIYHTCEFCNRRHESEEHDFYNFRLPEHHEQDCEYVRLTKEYDHG